MTERFKLTATQKMLRLSEAFDVAKENLDVAQLDENMDKAEFNKVLDRYETAKQKLLVEKTIREEELARAEDETQQKTITGSTQAERDSIAFGKALQSLSRNERVSSEVKLALNLSDTGTGGFYLPDNLAKKVVSEPDAGNPFSDVFSTTVNEQRVPLLTVTSNDKAFIQDGETAKEVLATGGSKRFEENTIKLFIDVTDQTLERADVGNLEGEIISKLREALNTKFYDVLVNEAPIATEKHMSLLANTNLTHYTGTDLKKAVRTARSAFPRTVRNKLVLAISEEVYLDFVDAQTLAIGADQSGKTPEQLLHVSKVIFADEFDEKFLLFVPEFGRYNLNKAPFIEKDKDIKNGMITYVITANFDFMVVLNSMFKTCSVVVTP